MGHIRAFIERNLADPNLSPATIAASVNISVRYLYKLFEQDGVTVSEWIRTRRLDNTARDLADPQLAHRASAGIGARWGFDDPHTSAESSKDAKASALASSGTGRSGSHWTAAALPTASTLELSQPTSTHAAHPASLCVRKGAGWRGHPVRPLARNAQPADQKAARTRRIHAHHAHTIRRRAPPAVPSTTDCREFASRNVSRGTV